MKSGFVAIIGRPNAGKSTLLNGFIGEKISIVSARPQTTRDKITGVLTTDEYQIAFVDTPGIHSPRNSLGGYMMKSVRRAREGVDCVLYVFDAGRILLDDDIEMLKRTIDNGTPVIVAVNKTDEVTDEKIASAFVKLKELDGISAIIPISALKKRNTKLLLDELVKLMPEGEKLFPDDMLTDKTERFLVSEMIREKALRYLSEEVPHGIGVEIKVFSERGNGIIDVEADIICEKESHKGIVIGKGGETLKRILTSARHDMEQLLGQKVFLKGFVKVKSEWRDSDKLMRTLGYDKKDI